MARILVAEDNTKQAELLSSYLTADGHEVLLASDGVRAIELLREQRPDLALLDVMMPGISGFDVARLALTDQLASAIIMVTARVAEDDQVHGLELGADDYICKPYSMRQLMARVRAVLRRTQSADSPTDAVQIGELRIDSQRCEVYVGGRLVELTARELGVLESLAEQPGRVLSRRYLLEQIAGFDSPALDRTVDMHIANLRRKIEPDPSNPVYVLTVKGRGYKLTDPRRLAPSWPERTGA